MNVNLRPGRASIGEELLFIASKASKPRAAGSTKHERRNQIGKSGKPGKPNVNLRSKKNQNW
jgi:hypothetical protein